MAIAARSHTAAHASSAERSPSITRAASRARSASGKFREASVEVSPDVGAASGASSIAHLWGRGRRGEHLHAERQSLERGAHGGAHGGAQGGAHLLGHSSLDLIRRNQAQSAVINGTQSHLLGHSSLDRRPNGPLQLFPQRIRLRLPFLERRRERRHVGLEAFQIRMQLGEAEQRRHLHALHR